MSREDKCDTNIFTWGSAEPNKISKPISTEVLYKFSSAGNHGTTIEFIPSFLFDSECHGIGSDDRTTPENSSDYLIWQRSLI